MRIEELIEREGLPSSHRHVVDSVYAPLAERIITALHARKGSLTIGLCGSQGSGKSTLSKILKTLLEQRAVTTAILSLDDLYRTRAERMELSERVHPLLITRGVPGTHDVDLGIRSLCALRVPGTVAMPSFDKALDERRPLQTWPRVLAPVRVTLFEGWCVGALPQSEAALAEPINALERDLDAAGIWRRYVNDALAGEYRLLFREIDLLILLRAPSFEVVYGWRLEQERKLRSRVAAAGSDASRVMSDSEVARFVAHYERITRHILQEMPARADVVIELDEQRMPVKVGEKRIADRG